MLKPHGLLVFTCASIGRPEHGTKRTTPGDSYGTIGQLQDMSDYYKNLDINDINKVLNLNKNFICWNSYYNKSSKDLYFIGIKTDGKLNNNYKLYPYKTENVIQTGTRS